jgi:hypothetical protein
MVCISFSPLPVRARRLDDAELSRLYGGCNAHHDRCSNLGGADKACCPPYECFCTNDIRCTCWEKLGDNRYR